MEWAIRIKPTKLRQLYRLHGRGTDSEQLMLDVGWALYALCESVILAVTGLRLGKIPCPRCGTAIQRRAIEPPSKQQQQQLYRKMPRRLDGWFRCVHCQTRLLWKECRDALRQSPRCFSCQRILHRDNRHLWCDCGFSWQNDAYRASVARRVRLPCPECNSVIRRPKAADQSTMVEIHRAPEVTYICSNCGSPATQLPGRVTCTACGHTVRWKSYKRSLKRSNEVLSCPSCRYEFRWQEWRRIADRYDTGCLGPAAAYLHAWPASRTPDEQVMQIDRLIQALHHSGPLGAIFIEGTQESTRALLDELADAC